MEQRRAYQRFRRHLLVQVVHAHGEVVCVTQNISLGGMLLVTTEPLPYGTEVNLLLRIPPSAEYTQIEAIVRWKGRDGMGVQFGALRAQDTWAFNQLFKECELDD